MSKYVLRLMTEQDIDDVALLENETLSNPWSKDQIKYEFCENPCSVIYVIEQDGKIVSYLDFMITFDSATISRIGTLNEYRHRGYASILLKNMIDVCRNNDEDPVIWITLEVRESNEPARKLYEKLGWQYVTIKKNYYEDGENAIYMMRGVEI